MEAAVCRAHGSRVTAGGVLCTIPPRKETAMAGDSPGHPAGPVHSHGGTALQRSLELVPGQVLPDGGLGAGRISQFSPDHVAHLADDGLLLLAQVLLTAVLEPPVQVLMHFQDLHRVHDSLWLLSCRAVAGGGGRGQLGDRADWAVLQGVLVGRRQARQLGLRVVRGEALPQSPELSRARLLWGEADGLEGPRTGPREDTALPPLSRPHCHQWSSPASAVRQGLPHRVLRLTPLYPREPVQAERGGPERWRRE